MHPIHSNPLPNGSINPKTKGWVLGLGWLPWMV